MLPGGADARIIEWQKRWLRLRDMVASNMVTIRQATIR